MKGGASDRIMVSKFSTIQLRNHVIVQMESTEIRSRNYYDCLVNYPKKMRGKFSERNKTFGNQLQVQP